MSSKTRFEKEAKGNSEMAYSKLAYYPSVQDSFTRENRYGQIGKIKKQFY